MSIIEAIILGIIQGLTEFIPVSSSGHLILAHELFGFDGGGLAFDVALHGGTLAALLIFFRADIVRLAKAFFIRGPETTPARLLALATIPAVISGVLLEGYAEDTFRSTVLVAVNLIFVAILMIFAEQHLARVKKPTELKDVSTKQAMTIGVAQAFAVIPGFSRSGSTITAGLFMGMDRIAATRFSFLLGIPIITGALVATVFSGGGVDQMREQPWVFIAGVSAALFSGLFAIRFLLKYLNKHTLRVFAYYRIGLGLLVLLLALL